MTHRGPFQPLLFCDSVCAGEGLRPPAGLAPGCVWLGCRGPSAFSPDSPSAGRLLAGQEGETPVARGGAQEGWEWGSELRRRRTDPHGPGAQPQGWGWDASVQLEEARGRGDGTGPTSAG